MSESVVWNSQKIQIRRSVTRIETLTVAVDAHKLLVADDGRHTCERCLKPISHEPYVAAIDTSDLIIYTFHPACWEEAQG